MSYTDVTECEDQNTALSIAKKVLKKDPDGNTYVAVVLETTED